MRAYLELMQMRMPDRLQLRLRIDPALRGLRFPPMALLTLVENAVRHGIDPSEEGGRIEVGAGATPTGSVRCRSQRQRASACAKRRSPAPGWPTCASALQAFFGARRQLRACSEQAPQRPAAPRSRPARMS